MREMLIYTILFLFCFVPVAAQEVPFEGLHLDDLITVPGKRKPGTVNHPVTSFDLLDHKLFSPDKLLIPYILPNLSFPSSIPMYSPRMRNLRSISLWKPFGKLTIRGNYFSSTSLPVETYSAYTVRSDVEAGYKLTNNFSLYLSTQYLSDRYRTPRGLYTRGVSGGVTYHLSDKFQLKSGVSYQYNTVFRKWEWMYLTGFIFSF